MASPSSSSSASSGINAAGGSVSRGPSVVFIAIIAVVALIYLYRGKNK